LSKEIDYWKTQADSLAQKLQETDATYSSKIDSVLAEQEYLAAQQQQVLRELNAAIAAHQLTTQQQQGDAAATAMGTGSSPPLGTVRTPELVS
jgi:predicted  nucleic acid-binding Zn-ribbon protein